MKGKEAYVARTPEAINEGIDWLTRAVTLDPDFAVAHAKLARAYMLQQEYAGLDRNHADFRSETHINRAMALAPDDWEVLSERAWSSFQFNTLGNESVAVLTRLLRPIPIMPVRTVDAA